MKAGQLNCRTQSNSDTAEAKPIIEVKVGVTNLRTVRVALMQLAHELAEHPGVRGVLALPDVAITRNRLRQEWEMAVSVLRHDLFERLTICIAEGDHLIGIPKDPDEKLQGAIVDAIAADRPRSSSPLPRADYSFVVLELLVHQWLLGHGPMATNWIMKTAGCSYQTVASVLRRMEHRLVRHSDRRIELRAFPKEEWSGLVATSERARGTIRYHELSGQPRSPESLIRRLQRIDRRDVAIGGVMGAQHYCPALDIVGSPRLDISLHCPKKAADLSFIEDLDPALVRTEKRDAPASVIVHHVRRKESLFQGGEGGIMWADPVECLLDLHEARLEVQAREFLTSFPAAKGQI